MFTLTQTSAFLKAKAPAAFHRFVSQVKQTFNFRYERANRLKRFDEVMTDYRANVPIADIRAKWGCSSSTIFRYIRLSGEEFRPRGRVPKEAILTMYKANKPIVEISARLGVSPARISQVATEAGINRKADKRRKT